jgi:quercetin dioxygenase-like cupin family protein
MSPINRSLAGPMLTFELEEQLRELRSEDSFRRSGRAGRTLTKAGRLRVTLVAMQAGNVLGTHQADSPMTLHVLAGHIRYRANDGEHELRAGELLFFGPGDAHDIRALEESALLVTIAAAGDDFQVEPPTAEEGRRQ